MENENLKLPLMILGTFGAILLVRVINLPFFYDDNELWMLNASRFNLQQILSAFIPAHGDVFLANVFYRPLTHLSWWLDGMLWGDCVVGYRVTNAALYLINTYLCFKIGLLVSKHHVRTAMYAAFVFLLHPAHIEVLCWTCARGDLLCLAFAAAAFYCYLKKAKRYMLTASALFALSLLCKETSIVLPFVVVLYDFLVREDTRCNITPWKDWVLFGLVCMLYLFMRWLFFKGLGGYNPGGTSLHLELLKSGLFTLYHRILEAPIHVLFFPWPGLVEDAGRYNVVKFVSASMVTIALVFSLRNDFLKKLLLFFFFLLFVMVSYAPGSVVEVTSTLQNSRMLYLTSMGASILMGCMLLQIPVKGKKMAEILPVSYIVLLASTSLLAFQPWENAGRILVKLPQQIRQTFGNLTEEQEIVFENTDLSSYQGALLFSTTPDAFSRALHVEFSQKRPKADWKHRKSAEKFFPAYARGKELGVDLFYARWDFESWSVIDQTEKYRNLFKAEQTNRKSTILATYSGSDILKNLLDSNHVTLNTADNGHLSVKTTRRDNWLAINMPPILPKRVEITWSSDSIDNTRELRFRLFWKTSTHPQWDASMWVSEVSHNTLPVNTVSLQIPYSVEDQLNHGTCLKALRVDPGGFIGQLEIHRVVFWD
ncbi:MAG: hypothetical protein CR997_03275 [Acidobacteria bacterium]|nr:MAG: hypothetical protein CR997_03275 [Acidobacteriota bacterium]